MTAPAVYQSGAMGQRPRRPQFSQSPQSPMGDGSPDANGLSQLPGTQSAPSGPPRPRFQTSHPPQPQQGQPQTSAPPPTFAQMQASGQARPAPPQIQQQHSMMPSPSAGASSFQGGAQAPSPSSAAPNSQLSGAISQALANPSAYGSQQVQDVFAMLKQQLGEGYSDQRRHLNDELAGRGLAESSIAGQRYSDLATEQARAEANMATQLASQAAQTYGQDRNSALQAGLGLGNLGISQGNLDLSRELGMGNLGLGQQQLAQQGSQFGQTLGENSRQFNAQNALAQQLGLGNLDLQRQQLGQSGNQFDRSLALQQLENQQQYGLQSNAQGIQQQQFKDQLAQAMNLGTMSDKTANRNVDLQASVASNDLLYRLLATVPGLSGLSDFLKGGNGNPAPSPTTPSGGPAIPSNPSDPRPTKPGNGDGDPVPRPGGPFVDDPNVYRRPGLGSRFPSYAGGYTAGGFTGYNGNTGYGDAPPPRGPDTRVGTPTVPTGPTGSPPPSSTPYGLSAALAAAMGVTTSTGDTPLIADQNLKKNQTQEQAATQYQQGAYNALQAGLANGTLSATTPGLSDAQFHQLLNARYQTSLASNHGSVDAALRALVYSPMGDIDQGDPRVQAFMESVRG